MTTATVTTDPTRQARRISGVTMSGVPAVALLGWGALAFGAVYPWSYWPLLVGAQAIGLWGLLQRSTVRIPRIVVAGFLLAMAGVLAQLVPLPGEVLAAWRPSADVVLQDYSVAYALGRAGVHPISINPAATWQAAAFVGSFGLLFLGLLRALTRGSVRCLCLGIIGLATLLALAGIIQEPMYAGKIYGFWEPETPGLVFGPFVNRNHFAGWMLLASAMAGGLLVGQLATTATLVKPGWRNRVLWLSGEEASRILLTTTVLLVMLVSIMWSMSRSGIAGTALALTLIGAIALRRVGSTQRRAIAAGAMVLLLLVAAGWRGADTLADRFGRTQTFAWRVLLWKDSLPALQDFWLVGSGLNTYDHVMRMYPQTDQKVHAQQAHGDYLQLAIEGGLLVGLPVLVLMGLFIREVRRRLKQPQAERTWWIRMGAVAGISGMALQETVEFSLQIPGVAVLFAVLVAVAIHEPAAVEAEEQERSRHRRRREVPSMVQV